MVDCCTWRHFLKIVIQDHFFLREHPFYNLSSWIAFSVYANYRVLLVHQNYLLQIQVLRSIINLKLINPCNVSSVVYTPLPDWFQSLVYAHNFGGNIGHNSFIYYYFYSYLCVIFILLYAHNFGGNSRHNLLISCGKPIYYPLVTTSKAPPTHPENMKNVFFYPVVFLKLEKNSVKSVVNHFVCFGWGEACNWRKVA